MKLPSIVLLSKESIAQGTQLPAWMDGLINFINQFLNPMTTALKNRLTFADNFACSVVTGVTFTHAVPVKVKTADQVFGMLPMIALKSTDTAVATKAVISGFGIQPLGEGNSMVTINFAGGAGITAEVTLVVFSG